MWCTGLINNIKKKAKNVQVKAKKNLLVWSQISTMS